MIRKAIRIGAVVLMFVSSSSIIGGQKLSRADSVLEGLLSSSLFRNADARTLSCELTAYCSGACCNSEVIMNKDGTVQTINWENRIAAGNCTMEQLRTAGIDIAAVDRSKIPFGSIIEYYGKYYAALDCGGMIKGDKIDLSMKSHSDADMFGRRYGQKIRVYIPGNPALAVKAILWNCR